MLSYAYYFEVKLNNLPLLKRTTATHPLWKEDLGEGHNI